MTNRLPSRALPNLARAGVALTRHGATSVTFEIHHLLDRPGYLFELAKAGSSSGFFSCDSEVQLSGSDLSTRHTFSETLSSAGYGSGLVVRTLVRPDPGPSATRSAVSGAQRVHSPDPSVWSFQGQAQPNPSFIYESVSALEGIVILDVEPRQLLVSHGVSIREIVTKIGEIAVAARSPLIYVQSPAQLPASPLPEERLGKRKEDWPRSSSLAVRFSIAIGRRSARDRSSLASELAEYCSASGWGLELRDTRPAHQSGNWFAIVQHDLQTARANAGSPGPRNRRAVNWVCPVTLVGPARVGSTLSIMRFLSRFSLGGVLGVSIASLDDLAFVHFEVALPDSSRVTHQRARNELAAWAQSSSGDLKERIHSLLMALQFEEIPKEDNEVVASLVERAGDYQLFAGPLVRARSISPASRSLWFSWDVENTMAGFQLPLLSLQSALSAHELCPASGAVPPGANIEYLLCRDVGNATLRARGKLAVPDEQWQRLLPGHERERARAGRLLAQSLEDSWRARFEDHAGVHGDISVAWEEAWLGRRSVAT